MALLDMTWKGRTLDTLGDLCDAMYGLTDEAEAQRFLAEVRAIQPTADSDLGYVIGYMEPKEARERLHGWLKIQHPIFNASSY